MRGARRVTVAAVAAGLVAFGGLAPSPAAAEELAPVERFAACVNGGGQGNLLLMMDTSGSLYNTDPQAGRVKAATATVTRLAGTLADVEADVDVAVAGFGTGYSRSLDWTPLAAGSLGAITDDLDSYATRIDSVDTDYWSAMDGARREFSARAQGQERACNLLMWFSDGEFAINKRADDAQMQRWGGPKPWVPDNRLRTPADVTSALEAGRSDLCRAGGIADQLRALDVITLGLGLAVDAPPESFELMSGISTGEGCGATTTPTPGEFLMADDVDDLIFKFITSLEQGDEGETPACVDAECPEGTRTFVLDGSIGAVNATAKAPVDGTRIFLKTRDGSSIELTQGTGSEDLGGSTLAWEWVTPRVLTLDLVRESPDNWAGPWGIVFVVDEPTDELANSSITLKGDIAPFLVNRDDLEARIGEEPALLELGAVDRLGQRIDPATLSDETFLDARLIAGGQTIELASGLVKDEIEEPIELDLDGLSPGVAELVLTLDVTTASWEEGGRTIPGTRLEPRHASIPLNILPPFDFPSIPDRISFGATESADPVTVQVPVEGDGCVWLAGETAFTGFPEGLDDATLTSPATDRASCAQGSLQLTLDPRGLGNGSFTGSTTVMLAAADSGAEPIPAELAFDLSQNRPASQPVLWGVLIAVTLLGVAIPVGILYLVKYLTAKIPGNAVLAGTVSGPVDDHRSFTDNGVPIGVANLTVAHLTNRREVSVAGRTLKTRMGASPTEPGHVVVDTPGLSAGGRTTLQSVGGNAKLPLAVQGNWMVALDPQRPVTGPVEVTVFTAPGAPGFNELLEDVRANIRPAVARLREGMAPEQPGAGGAPSAAGDPWSTPQGQTPPRNDPWANPPGGNGPTSGPGTW